MSGTVMEIGSEPCMRSCKLSAGTRTYRSPLEVLAERRAARARRAAANASTNGVTNGESGVTNVGSGVDGRGVVGGDGDVVAHVEVLMDDIDMEECVMDDDDAARPLYINF